MAKLKKYLGKIDGDRIYLSYHKWDCGWYWGFGYIGNRNCHFHISSLMETEMEVANLFEKSPIDQAKWWKLREYFLQAYVLRNCAEVYRYGANNTTVDIVIKDTDMATRLNKDLEIILQAAWDLID